MEICQPDGYLTCDDCGRTGPDVDATICPYALDIHGTEVEAQLCNECHHERCMDI